MAWSVVSIPVFPPRCHRILSLQHLHSVQANFRSQPLLHGDTEVQSGMLWQLHKSLVQGRHLTHPSHTMGGAKGCTPTV